MDCLPWSEHGIAAGIGRVMDAKALPALARLLGVESVVGG
jgi:hypothetical protein